MHETSEEVLVSSARPKCEVANCGTEVGMGLKSVYCGGHHQAVVVEGDDPARLARCTDWRDQCQATGFFDGANCCARRRCR